MNKVIFTIASEDHMKYERMLEKSLRKFHTAEELPLVVTIAGCSIPVIT